MSTPVSDAIAASLSTWDDPAGAWNTLNRAYGSLLEQVYAIVGDVGSPDVPASYTPGFSILLDPVNAPAWALPYTGLYVGVVIPPGTDEATARALILAEGGFTRGTPGAIIAAAKLWLSGNKTVALLERTAADATTPDPYHFVLIVPPEEAQPTNIAPNPSFEYDTVGTTPAGWTNFSGWNTDQVANTWAASGTQSLHLVSTAGSVGTTATAYVGTGSVSHGNITVSGDQVYYISAVVNVNSITSGAECEILAEFYTGVTGLGGAATNTVSTTGVHTLSALVTVPSTATHAAFSFEVIATGGGSTNSMDVSLDDVLIVQVPSGVSSLPYFDGDFNGYSWAGTPGDSSSQASLQPLKNAVDAVRPAGVFWTLVLSDWTLTEMEAAYASITLLEAAFTTITNLESDVT